VAIKHKIDDLPIELTQDDAVEAVYGADVEWIEDKLRQRMSCLIECDMQLVTFLSRLLRTRLRISGRGGSFRCRFITGVPQEGEQQRTSLLGAMIRELADHVRSAEPGTIIVIPHIDLLTTTTRGGLSDNAKEVIALGYENPEVTLLAFKDPSLELPKVIDNLFAAKRSLLGIPRDRITRIMVRREGKKFGVADFDPFTLYKYVSGLNAVRFRQIMEHIQDRLDFDPHNPECLKRLYRDIRELTLGGELEVPRVDLETDIGGYTKVKERIDKDILKLYKSKEDLIAESDVKAIEELIPKGIIFEGPPGTGKTYFAKAIATALDATAIVVSGPELKSKWVGESEQNLRKIFTRARQSAPAIIIFDELDSFAVRRGTYTGSGVEHSMVNQLLTEMDGFRKEELVFIIGTTNYVEALDEALLRPGRFELTIKIPYPNEKDRHAILEVYRKKFDIEIPDDVFAHLVRKTGGYANVERRIRFSGDHLYAICRAMARENIRKGKHPISVKEIDDIIGDTFAIRPPTKEEEKTIAAHESGHALAACLLEHAPPPEKVSIEGMEDSPVGGFVMQERRRGDHVLTRRELVDEICVLLGGRAAEKLVLGTISTGAENDLLRATAIAREMVERWGMVDEFSQMVFISPSRDESGGVIRRRVSDTTEERVDQQVELLLKRATETVHSLLTDNHPMLTDMIASVTKSRVLEKEEIEKIAARHGTKLSWQDEPKDESKEKKAEQS
jgi:cell division protease FtsH